MNINEILSVCDHTLLKQEATWPDIQNLCDEARKYRTASVCIPPCFVADAHAYLGKDIPVCTVIGFPNGNMTTKTKLYETEDALKNGADEIDMVININMLKSNRHDYVLSEIKQLKSLCDKNILKVIIETCLLTEEEKIEMCRIVSASGADYIKTSTGFSTAGATFDDIRLFKKYVDPAVKIKAAGGISTLEDAQKFIELGADRLGTSRVVKIAKQMGDWNYI
jgi:deoxyribose-phosphate aldolase